MDFSIPRHGGGRTQEQQDEIYAQGRTKPGKIVTWTRNSNHLVKSDGKGHAFDAVPYVKGKIDWDSVENFYFLSTLMYRAAMELGLEIEWGYHKWGKDMPHWQLKE